LKNLLGGGLVSLTLIWNAAPAQTAAPSAPPAAKSTLGIYDLGSGAIRTIYSAEGFYEAPCWSRDGKYIYINGGPLHKLYRVPVSGGPAEMVDFGSADIDHDHGFSPDGKWHALNIGTQLFVSTADAKNLHPITKLG
jgi:hypothetical protein